MTDEYPKWVYPSIRDEDFARWEEEHRSLPWHRKLMRWLRGLKWCIREWLSNLTGGGR